MVAMISRHGRASMVAFRRFCTKVNDMQLLIGAYCIPHPAKMETGGEDAYFIWEDEHGCRAFGCADGVGGYSLQGIDAGYFSRFLMKACYKELSENPTYMPVEILNKAYKRLRKKHIEGGCTAVICNILGEDIHVSNLGDSGVVIFRENKKTSEWDVVCKTTPQQHFFNCPYQLGGTDSPYDSEILKHRLEENDVLVCATDGLFDNIFLTTISQRIKFNPENMQTLSEDLASEASEIGRVKSPDISTPFAEEANRNQMTFFGGKLDDVTIIAGKAMPI